MIKKVQKRTLLLIGVLLTSVISSLSGYMRSNFSQNGSLFVESAHADLQPWPSGWDSGGGCGGCSAGSSGY